jgi:DNA mismatch repair ATPase MutS
MEQEIIERYQSLADLYRKKYDQQKFRLRLISWMRLAFFLLLVATIIFLVPVSHTIGWMVVLAFMAGFLLLIKQSVNTERLLNYYQNLVAINLNEIKALGHDFTPFNGGNEYIHPEHDYSFDLDLFGDNSFFQFINRTVTIGGKNTLAASVQNSKENNHTIRQKQEAIAELADCLDWRQQFLASGYKAENIGSAGFILQQPTAIQLKHTAFLKVTLIILPVITLTLGVLWILNILPSQLFSLAVTLQWGLFFLYWKTIGEFKKAYGLKTKLLNQYVDMLTLIEKKEFKSNYLVQLKSMLYSQGKAASELTSSLQKVLNELDYSQNILVGFALDSILLWDIRCIYRLNQWHNAYESYVAGWFEVIAQMDALISFANINYNHPDWVLPELIDSESLFQAKNLGHPLIPSEKRIGNDFFIQEDERIVIITGANMAGKSTFLRTLGVNLILAAQGCNVCASSFSFTPMRLFTHMRTSDNLMKDESYFYAELLRLHHMLELLRQGENLFIIIDEMLKGTNSIDKLNGSVELLKQLINYHTHCVVATHDLKLTELASSYPRVIKNQCFEVNLSNNDLEFDYKLRDGVTSTMNATFLMRKMGIIS